MRYPYYDGHVLRFVREAPPVVFEIQTKFDLELPAASAVLERQWATQLLPEAAGLVAVTPEILAYERARAGWDIPGHVMSNGADPDSIPFTAPRLAADRIDLVCVASFYAWHGVDRIICGMAAEPDVQDVHLHLVGDGPALAQIKALAADLGVTDRVHCAGLKAPGELTPWYAQAHLAIGVLAPQRKQLTELSALKHREYALRGVPFIAAGTDCDFPSTLPWMRTVPADDSPISPRMLRAFAMSWTHEKRRRQIRTWAEAHVSWSAKIPPLLTFLHERRRARLLAEVA
jgi:glycosyltransferase involved in cell wall biosynthesis